MIPLTYRSSTPSDDPALRALLALAELPTDDVATGPQSYRLALEGTRLVGSAGIEVHGEDALVRSVAVAPDRRGRGIAAALVERIHADARARRVRTTWLLTETAEAYMARHGYVRVDRAHAPASIAATAQFRSLCPTTSTCMRLTLGSTAQHYPADVLALRPSVPGAAFWAVSLEKAMLTYFEIEPESRFERHAHEAEQITLVLDGALYFELEPDRVVRLGPGEAIAIPANVPHAAWTGPERTRAVDAWSPPRTW